MAVIQLSTKIFAPVAVCFDLSRSIDTHIESMAHTRETAIDGVTSGLINLGETVTWKARHFYLDFKMTIKITEFDYPNFFVDEMVKGPFKSLHHTHVFEEINGYTIMNDSFNFRSPAGVLGKIADHVFLKKYMKKLLERRNETIKCMAENA